MNNGVMGCRPFIALGSWDGTPRLSLKWQRLEPELSAPLFAAASG